MQLKTTTATHIRQLNVKNNWQSQYLRGIYIPGYGEHMDFDRAIPLAFSRYRGKEDTITRFLNKRHGGTSTLNDVHSKRSLLP